jgi:cytochrome P450
MAFHELVRFEGAVQAESRAVAADAIVGGRQVRAGDIVVVLVGSANRDSDVFKDAGDLCLDRAPNPHLGFGRGIHACIGTRLALMLGVGILNQVLGEFRLRLTGSPVQRPTATLRGLDALPVSVERRQLEKTA